MRTVIGKVVGLTGEAQVVDQHGQQRVLKAGDTLHDGEQLITVTGAHVDMQAANGEIVMFAEQQAITLADVLAPTTHAIDISEYAVNPAVIHHVLATLQMNDAFDLWPPLASMLHEEAFVSTAHASITEQTVSAQDALNINDVIISGEAESSVSSTVLPVTQLADLMAHTSGLTDMGLQDSPLKDFLKD